MRQTTYNLSWFRSKESTSFHHLNSLLNFQGRRANQDGRPYNILVKIKKEHSLFLIFPRAPICLWGCLANDNRFAVLHDALLLMEHARHVSKRTVSICARHHVTRLPIAWHERLCKDRAVTNRSLRAVRRVVVCFLESYLILLFWLLVS